MYNENILTRGKPVRKKIMYGKCSYTSGFSHGLRMILHKPETLTNIFMTFRKAISTKGKSLKVNKMNTWVVKERQTYL